VRKLTLNVFAGNLRTAALLIVEE